MKEAASSSWRVPSADHSHWTNHFRTMFRGAPYSIAECSSGGDDTYTRHGLGDPAYINQWHF